MSDMIVLENLTKRFGDLTAVDAVSMSVARGEVLVLNDNFCIRVSEILPLDGATMGREDGVPLAVGPGGAEHDG